MSEKNILKKAYHHGNLKQTLLNTARKIIDEEGSGALTMRRVAQDIGVSATATYRHFANRDELLAGVLVVAFNELGSAMREARLAATHPVEGFLATGYAYLDFAMNNKHCYQVLFSAECNKVAHPELGEAGNAAFKEVITSAQLCYDKGFLGSRQPMEIAMAGWINTHGLASAYLDGVFQWVVPMDMEEATESLFKTLMEGVAPSATDFISNTIRKSVKKYLR